MNVLAGLEGAELAAELLDMTAAVWHAERRLHEARQAASDQWLRSFQVYGDRSGWPASSEHAVRELDAASVRIEEGLRESRAYLAALEAEAASR